MADDSIKIVKFDGKNFGLWKKQVIVVLRTKGLNAAVVKAEDGEDRKTTEDQDNRAQAVILSALEGTVMQKIIACDTAAEMWERLQQIYENSDPASVGKVLEEYYSYRKNSSDDMATHVSKVEALALHLKQIGQEQTEISIMSKLLHSLPAEYESLKEAWNSVHPDHQTKVNLIARMLAHNGGQSEQPATAEEVALIASSGQGPGKFRAFDIKKVKCYKCGQLGHFKRDCPENFQLNYNSSRQHNAALMLGRGTNRDKWLVDSGSSRHVSCRKDWFETMRGSSVKVQVGNEEWVQAYGVGDIKLFAKIGGSRQEVILKDVLYAPKITHNLFSTVQATERGAKITFEKKCCRISLDNQLLITGRVEPESGLCYLDAETRRDLILLASTKRTLGDWHGSLGHADQRASEEMIENSAAEGRELMTENVMTCENCTRSKATRVSRLGGITQCIENTGELVDIDLIGPIQESLGKSKYLLVAKDRYSGYGWVRPLRSKKETCLCLQELIAHFEVASGNRIKSIITSNGGELVDMAVRTLLGLEHIKLELSAPQQNGTAERFDRAIIEATRTALSASGLPHGLWAEAAASASYSLNRVVRNGEAKTPFELFTGRRPFVGHLVPFGEPVQCLITDKKVSKFDPKIGKGNVVGYTDRSNTYRVYIPSMNRVKVSCDVILAEPEQRAIDKTFHELNAKMSTSQSNLEPIISMGVSRSQQTASTEMDQREMESSSHILTDHKINQMSILTDSRSKNSHESTPTIAQKTGSTSFQGRKLSRRPPPAGPKILLTKTELIVPGPSNSKKTETGPNIKSWVQAIKAELMVHIKNRTWSIVKRPGAGTLLPTNWVFKHKRDSAGDIERYKAQLVAKDVEQTEGANNREKAAPTTRGGRVDPSMMPSTLCLRRLCALVGSEVRRVWSVSNLGYVQEIVHRSGEMGSRPVSWTQSRDIRHKRFQA